MSGLVHFLYSGVGVACGFAGYGEVAYGWSRVSCRSCLARGIERQAPNAIARLAELDRMEQVTASTGPANQATMTMPMPSIQWIADRIHSINIPLTSAPGAAPSSSHSYAEVVPSPRDALLLRASSFIADLPSGSLDRARNGEAMAIRRAIVDLVVGKDKVVK